MTPTSDELRKLLDAASPGPWLIESKGKDEEYDVERLAVRSEGQFLDTVADNERFYPHEPSAEDLRLIALAPELADELIRLREQTEAMAEALVHIDALDPENMIDVCAMSALRGLVLRMGETARAALTAYRATQEQADGK